MVTISVTPFNIGQGAGVLYVAPWVNGAATPLTSYIGTNPGGVDVTDPFVDVGGTTGGITVEVDETLSNIAVDQILDPVGARVTARTIQVTTTLMETHIPNLVSAMNGLTAVTVDANGDPEDGTTPSAGYAQMSLVEQTSATQPIYSSLIVDGWGPTMADGTPAKRRFIIPKVLSQPKISQKFSMADQATVDVTFTAFYVGDSQSPLYIIDQTTTPTPPTP